MLVDHIISEIYNSMIWEVILIGDSTTLLDYGHKFKESLHAMDNSDVIALLLADWRVGRVHQLSLCSPWALGWMHYKIRVCVFLNSNCF